MLTSLIAVLVLLVIGFYAVTTAVIGRAGVGEAQLLGGRRLALGLAGVSALVLAYVIYSHPLGSGDPPSGPGRWSELPAELGPSPAADAAQADAPPATAEPAPGAKTDESGASAAAPEPVMVAVESGAVALPATGAEEESSLSASAAAIEAELRRRRQALPALAMVEPSSPTPGPAVAPSAKPRPAEAPPATTVAPPRRADRALVPALLAPAVRPANPGARRLAMPAPGPLTIVVHNQLGAAQQSERLALLIEGKRVASFEITEAAPAIALPIHLPRPGLLHYRIEGESLQGGRLSLKGEGCISAVEGARFQVRRRSSDSHRVFLESVING